jgi:hypothetical protein
VITEIRREPIVFVELAFIAYETAVDVQERAADLYARLLRRARRFPKCDRDPAANLAADVGADCQAADGQGVESHHLAEDRPSCGESD